jgi:hypothetical protein
MVGLEFGAVDDTLRHVVQARALVQVADPVTEARGVRRPVEGALVQPVGPAGIAVDVQRQHAVVENQPLDVRQRIGRAGPVVGDGGVRAVALDGVRVRVAGIVGGVDAGCPQPPLRFAA